MNLKSEKGFTGVDIAIAIVVIFIFTSVIAILVYNFNASSKELERRTQATYYAISEIENIKKQSFSAYSGRNKNNNSVNPNEESIKDSNNKDTGYYRTITVLDYNDIDSTKITNIVKKITVEISYMSQGKRQSVSLSTVLAKE